MNKNELARIRIKHGLTQEEMAVKLGFSRSYYAQVECGARNVSKKVATKIANLFANDGEQNESVRSQKNESEKPAQEEEVCPICHDPECAHVTKYQPREVVQLVEDNNIRLQRIDNSINQLGDVLQMVTHLDEFVERKIDAQNDKLFAFIAGQCNIILSVLSVTITILLSGNASNEYAAELLNQAKQQVNDLLLFAKSRGH